MDFQTVKEVMCDVLRDLAADSINNKMLYERGDISHAASSAVRADILSRTSVIEEITNKLEKKYKTNN